MEWVLVVLTLSSGTIQTVRFNSEFACLEVKESVDWAWDKKLKADCVYDPIDRTRSRK